jgi:NAD(P)-dependent dehydrogenase (short-subunit alcohol dehydrogenase family)
MLSLLTHELPMTSDQKVAVVTGSSSGMWFETSLILARNGFYTYATMHKLDGGAEQITDIAENEKLPLQVIQLDVNDNKSVIDAINRIKREKDRIDIVVNNAGYDLEGAIEEISMDEMRSQFETNFFGAVRVMKEIIPIMRNQKNAYLPLFVSIFHLLFLSENNFSSIVHRISILKQIVYRAMLLRKSAINVGWFI